MPQHSTESRPRERRPTVRHARRHGEIQAFLDGFARALTTGDARRVAEMWDTPAFVIGAEMSRAVESRHEIELFFAGSREEYNKRGVTDTRPEVERVAWANDRLVLVDVRWPYLNRWGAEVGAESSSYVIGVDEEGGFKLRVAVMHGVETH